MNVLIITGPTGVGKSGFAEKIAAHIPSEIVNVDVGQLYVPLSIGTAKPDWRKATVPHHLFDILDKPDSISVVQYRDRLKETIQDIKSRGKTPIIVGGSGFYINSLFFPPQAAPSRSVESAKKTHQELWDELYAIDPVRAGQIHQHDSYRVQRALDIWHQEKQKPSEYTPPFEPIDSVSLLFVSRERPELYDRINERTHQMFQEKWVDEVRKLQGTSWEPFLLNKKLIGYDDIFQYLQQDSQEQDLDRLIATIQKKTRHYAKRQSTYNRMLMKKLAAQKSSDILVQEINLSLQAVPDVIKLIVNSIDKK